MREILGGGRIIYDARGVEGILRNDGSGITDLWQRHGLSIENDPIVDPVDVGFPCGKTSRRTERPHLTAREIGAISTWAMNDENRNQTTLSTAFRL